jgi:hypothetical protein
MAIRLRGHHLLCLLGYRGMGYSADFCTNMTAIYEALRTKPDTEVDIVEGPDDICRAYPADQNNHCEGTVFERDREVLAKLGLTPGDKISWRTLCGKIKEDIAPEDIGHLCASCPWEPYGVCRDGVRLVAEGKPLPKVDGVPQ